MSEPQLPKYGDPEFDPLKEAELLKQRSLARAEQAGDGSPSNPGCSIAGCGLILAFFPILIAFISTSSGHNMFNESDSSSGGTALWALIVTVPIGLLIALIGGGIGAARAIKRASNNAREKSQRNSTSDTSQQPNSESQLDPTDPRQFDNARVADIYEASSESNTTNLGTKKVSKSGLMIQIFGAFCLAFPLLLGRTPSAAAVVTSVVIIVIGFVWSRAAKH